MTEGGEQAELLLMIPITDAETDLAEDKFGALYNLVLHGHIRLVVNDSRPCPCARR